MTVIAWDGKTIAADRQSTSSDLRRSTSKLRRLPSGEIITGTGDKALILALTAWYEAGAKEEEWPDFQSSDDWCRLIILGPKGIRFYERFPHAIDVEESFTAFGSGRDYAIGALAMGADARRAIEVANEYCITCGLGVDTMSYDPAANFGAVVRADLREAA